MDLIHSPPCPIIFFWSSSHLQTLTFLSSHLFWDFISSFYSSSFFTIAILILQTQTIITVTSSTTTSTSPTITSARRHHHIRRLLLLVPHLRGPQSHPPPPPRYSTTSDHLLHYHHCFCLNQKRFFLYPHYSLLSSNLKDFCFTFFFSDLDSWMEMWDWRWRTEVSNKRKEVFTRLRKDEKTNEGWGRLIRQTKLE